MNGKKTILCAPSSTQVGWHKQDTKSKQPMLYKRSECVTVGKQRHESKEATKCRNVSQIQPNLKTLQNEEGELCTYMFLKAWAERQSSSNVAD